MQIDKAGCPFAGKVLEKLEKPGKGSFSENLLEKLEFNSVFTLSCWNCWKNIIFYPISVFSVLRFYAFLISFSLILSVKLMSWSVLVVDLVICNYIVIISYLFF